jgi:hypothetical protein
MHMPNHKNHRELDLPLNRLLTETIAQAADNTWILSVQLTPDEQAVLNAAAQSGDELCRRAQHTLGMAGFGSRIYRERTAVGVYISSPEARFDTTPLILDGAEVLWFVGTASVDEVRLLIQAAQRIMDAEPKPENQEPHTL